jgi:cytochrome c oxidase subunit 2
MRPSRRTAWRAGAAAALTFAAAGGAAGAAPAGQSLYASCVTCHGRAGEGVAAVKAPAIAGLEAWYLERQLQHFAAGVRGAAAGDTEGATMRAAAAVLKSDAERASVAAYVAGLPRTRPPHRAPTNAASETNGRNYFNALCSACHGAGGQGNQSLGAPRLAGANPEYLARQFAAFKAGRRGAHPDDKLGAQMRAIAAMLPNAATEQDVLAYVSGLPP